MSWLRDAIDLDAQVHPFGEERFTGPLLIRTGERP
jgi:hypothetical protein